MGKEFALQIVGRLDEIEGLIDLEGLNSIFLVWGMYAKANALD